MANSRLIEFELPPVRHASEEGLWRFTGGVGGLHWGVGVASRLEFLRSAEGRNRIVGMTGRDWWSKPLGSDRAINGIIHPL